MKISPESAKQNSKILLYQLGMILLFLYFVMQTIYYIVLTVSEGQTALIFLTFLFAFGLDQCKSFITLGAVYVVVVRRFGFLKENETEWVNKELYAEKKENALPKMQQLILKILETQYFEGFSLFMIAIYAVFILFDLTFADLLNVQAATMEQIDSVFLTFFFVEIWLKVFATSGVFFIDFFNCFDAAIVFLSEILNWLGIIAKGLGVLRLLRVVVITIRKITGNTSKLRHQSKNNNPVDSVIKILQ